VGETKALMAPPEAAADELLSAMASIRRIGRRRATRPEFLGSLTGAQLELVKVVRRRPRISVAEAGRELYLAPNTISTLVKSLSQLGILVRRKDTEDRRVGRLDLEADIRSDVNAWRDRRVDAIASGIRALSPSAQEHLASSLSVLQELSEVLEIQVATVLGSK
jgi:DNA-binding MarR family transcriptional regulator